jgi:hypothetical protein
MGQYIADFIFVALSLAFFAASLGLIHLFEKLREGK